MTALLGLICDLASAKAAGRSDAELAAARSLQRGAQFYLDFVEASRQGRIALRDPGFKPTVPVPEIPNK